MIVLLSSGVTLGTYVPAVLIRDRLRAAGQAAEVAVFESLFPPDRRRALPRLRTALAGDFRKALVSQRMMSLQQPVIDAELRRQVLANWRTRRIDWFIVLSGTWREVVTEYADTSGFPVTIDLCHLDAVDMPSMASWVQRRTALRETRLVSREPPAVNHTIVITQDPPVPWAQRDSRLLVHGGGWGIGTFREDCREIRKAGWSADVVLNDQAETARIGGGELGGFRYFSLNPRWTAWDDGGFPPLGRISRPGDDITYEHRSDHHWSFELSRNSVGIVSKPGGGTLLDSFATATPIVFLDPFGPHEGVNAECWQRLGFGISLATWRESGHAPGLLHECHLRLLAARSGATDYVQHLLSAENLGYAIDRGETQ